MPVPLVVTLLVVVGAAVKLQHTPRSVTADPPSEVIVPPETEVLEVMALMAVVDKVGKPGVVNVTWFP